MTAANTPTNPFAEEEPPKQVICADAPCDYGHCHFPWTRRVQGRYVCEKHAPEVAVDVLCPV